MTDLTERRPMKASRWLGVLAVTNLFFCAFSPMEMREAVLIGHYVLTAAFFLADALEQERRS